MIAVPEGSVHAGVHAKKILLMKNMCQEYFFGAFKMISVKLEFIKN